MSGAATVDVDETPRRDVRASTAHLRNPAVLGLIVALACSATFLLILQSHLTFFGDDWKFLLDRRGSSPSVFLDPHNDHIAVAGVHLVRFADHPAVDLGQLGAGQPASLGIPSDRSGRPWRLALVGLGPVRVCALPNAG